MKLRIIKTKKPFGKDTRIGIHLLNPTELELERAKEDARAKLFPAVYVHTSDSGIQNAAYRPN